MFSSRDFLRRGARAVRSVQVVLLLAAATTAFAQSARFPNIGREATPQEVAAWDIDVRADFKGLPAGSGSVAKGQDVWESKCASCHGVFGEANSVFNPLVGGTTADDIKTGHVARLNDRAYPGRTTLMKVATLSTLWDYINRAMPWTQPKSLTTEEVYAVTAFMLNLGGIVPDDFTLSDKNIREVQARMPNRNGMTTAHALWPGTGLAGATAPDTRNVACMNNCAVEPRVASMLPDFARDAHGNLAEQNRTVGAQHGADTSRPASRAQTAPVADASPAPVPSMVAAPSKPAGAAAKALAQKYNCTACHNATQKIVGPSFADIARKYPGKVDYLAGKIVAGGSGVWGPIPMPPQSLGAADAKTLASWLASGAGQ